MADIEKDINVQSDDFKSGYRQGYIDGMNAAADRILGMFNELEEKQKESETSTDDGK